MIHSHHVYLDMKTSRIVFLPVPKPTLIPKSIILLTSRMPRLKLRERDHNIVVVDMKHRPLTTTLTSHRIVKLQFVNTERATNVTTKGALSRNFWTKGYNFSQAH